MGLGGSFRGGKVRFEGDGKKKNDVFGGVAGVLRMMSGQVWKKCAWMKNAYLQDETESDSDTSIIFESHGIIKSSQGGVFHLSLHPLLTKNSATGHGSLQDPRM